MATARPRTLPLASIAPGGRGGRAGCTAARRAPARPTIIGGHCRAVARIATRAFSKRCESRKRWFRLFYATGGGPYFIADTRAETDRGICFSSDFARPPGGPVSLAHQTTGVPPGCAADRTTPVAGAPLCATRSPVKLNSRATLSLPPPRSTGPCNTN